MISKLELTRCIEILAKLNANTSNRENKQLILELGYIIKQELDLVDSWHHSTDTRNIRNVDVGKLIEDNRQLFHENEKLIDDIRRLKEIIDSKIPEIQSNIGTITRKFDALNKSIEAL